MTDKEFYIQNKPAWQAPVFYCERKTLEDARGEKEIKRGPSSSFFHVFPRAARLTGAGCYASY